MSTGWLIVCLVLGASVVCIWAYFRGQRNGYIDGYEAGQAAVARCNTKQVNEVKKRGLAAQQTIDYLYAQAGQEIEGIDSPPGAPGRG